MYKQTKIGKHLKIIVHLEKKNKYFIEWPAHSFKIKLTQICVCINPMLLIYIHNFLIWQLALNVCIALIPKNAVDFNTFIASDTQNHIDVISIEL